MQSKTRIALTVLWATACSNGLEIEGTYTDPAEFVHRISSEQWEIDAGDYGASTYVIADFDNADGWVVAQNSEDNDFNPGDWSRFEWTEADDELFVCQVLFDGEDRAAAEDAGPADAADPASTGCGEFPWSLLTPQ